MERILGKLLGLFFTIALVRYKNKTYMYSKFGLTRKAREKAIYKTLQEAKSDLKVKFDIIRLTTVSKVIEENRSYPSFAREVLIPRLAFKNAKFL